LIRIATCGLDLMPVSDHLLSLIIQLGLVDR
jgi:hypothetical protein